MDSLTHASLPPSSYSTTHSSVGYQRNLACASDYQEEYRRCSGITTPTLEMSEYYLPINGVTTNYQRAQATLPIAPSTFRPPHHCSGEGLGEAASLRPTSSSSMESNLKDHDELQPPQEPQRGRYPALRTEASFQSFQDAALTPIDNYVMSNSSHSSDEPKCEGSEPAFSNTKEEYSDEMSKSDLVKFELAGRDTSPTSKVVTGKKLTNVKVSEKRRQQNRAAQRAMRERRKRAAQHQEIHMTAILTENAILREKVTYLSNVLLSHTIAPANHLSWTPMPQQENSSPMLPHLNIANLPSRSAAPPTSSASTSPFSFSNHPIFPSANLPGTAGFPSAQSSLMSYYPSGSLDLEYLHQGRHVPALRNISCPSSTSNLSRPSTADEASVDNRASVFGRWKNSSSHEGASFQADSPMAGRIGQFALAGSIATDSCSINTASTISSPTHTDGQLGDPIPTNL